MNSIPIVIICFNNYRYVQNTISQLEKLSNEYKKQIIVLNNKSTCDDTIRYLDTLADDVKVINNYDNLGPWINKKRNSHIYNMLPDKYIVTDPDLEFNKDLPVDFVDQLRVLSDKYNCINVGFALDITNCERDMLNYPDYFDKRMSIYELESSYWVHKIPNDEYELYKAPIDTTFGLFNKRGNPDLQIRVAGCFTAKHLPWYKENPLFNVYENYKSYEKTMSFSTIAKFVKRYTDEMFEKIVRNDVYFFIRKQPLDPNMYFWTHAYPTWEEETFAVFDRFLRPDKVCIDLGAWIGSTCIYASHKSKHVYAIEADKESVPYLVQNCNDNCRNCTIIPEAVYCNDNVEMNFGKNLFLPGAKLNQSTSHLYVKETDTSDQMYSVKTLTMKTLFDRYKIDYNDVSLVKVDLEGGEEHILEDLQKIHENHGIPMYITFHYSWWLNKDLDRFAFLTNEQKSAIHHSGLRPNGYISILFD